MIPLQRILTRKSKLGFGKHKDYTVQELLDLRKAYVLISPYYKLTSINYIEDVLLELGITEEYRIPKPSSDKDMYFKFRKDKGLIKEKVYQKGFRRVKQKIIRNEPFNKGALQRKNQGK